MLGKGIYSKFGTIHVHGGSVQFLLFLSCGRSFWVGGGGLLEGAGRERVCSVQFSSVQFSSVQAKYPRASSVTQVHRCSRKVGLDNKQTNKNYERELMKPNPRSRGLPSWGRIPLLPVSIGSLGCLRSLYSKFSSVQFSSVQSSVRLLSGACYVAVGATLPGGRASWRVPMFQPQEYMSATKPGLMRTFGHAPNKKKRSVQFSI